MAGRLDPDEPRCRNFGRETLGVVYGLWATLDWSYDLLSEREKTVLCRLSVSWKRLKWSRARQIATDGKSST